MGLFPYAHFYMDLKTRIDSLYESYQNSIAQEGENYRERVIIPFCEKYRLSFLSGNGTYAFFDKELKDFEVSYGLNGEDCSVNLSFKSKLRRSERFAKEVKEIFGILDLELTWADHFGYYVRSVK